MVITNEKHIYLFHVFRKKKKYLKFTDYTVPYLTTCLFEEKKKIHLEI